MGQPVPGNNAASAASSYGEAAVGVMETPSQCQEWPVSLFEGDMFTHPLGSFRLIFPWLVIFLVKARPQRERKESWSEYISFLLGPYWRFLSPQENYPSNSSNLLVASSHSFKQWFTASIEPALYLMSVYDSRGHRSCSWLWIYLGPAEMLGRACSSQFPAGCFRFLVPHIQVKVTAHKSQVTFISLLISV